MDENKRILDELKDWLTKKIDWVIAMMKRWEDLSWKLYVIERQDDDNWESCEEIYKDRKESEERFFELVKTMFYYDLQEDWCLDMKFWNLYKYESDNISFTKDCFWTYRNAMMRNWNWEKIRKVFEWWVRCFSNSYHAELRLREINLWEKIIDDWIQNPQ